jgi:hypothetical protein
MKEAPIPMAKGHTKVEMLEYWRFVAQGPC